MPKSKIIGEESGILANPSFIFAICVSLALLISKHHSTQHEISQTYEAVS
jgi:hypothetical protein